MKEQVGKNLYRMDSRPVRVKSIEEIVEGRAAPEERDFLSRTNCGRLYGAVPLTVIQTFPFANAPGLRWPIICKGDNCCRPG
jgi:hypothetical protein